MRHNGEYQMATVEQLAERLARAHDLGHKTAVLLGAGASKSAGIPLAGELVDEIGEKYPRNVVGVEHTYTAYMQRLTHSERRELLDPYVEKAKITRTYTALANLVDQGYVDVVLNVNFDFLAEKCLQTNRVCHHVYDLANSGAYQHGRIKLPALIYLHGKHDGFDNIHTDDGMTAIQDQVSEVLKEQLSNRTVLVVGYSGLVDPVFAQLCRAFVEFDRGLYWITLRNDPARHVLDNLLSDPNKQAYFMGGLDSDSFFLALEEALGLPALQVFGDPIGYVCGVLGTFAPSLADSVLQGLRLLSPERASTPRLVVSAGPREATPDLARKAAAAWDANDYEALAELAPFALESEDEVARKYVSWGVYNRATTRAEAALQKQGAERHLELLVARDELELALRVLPSLTEGRINLGLVLSHLAKSSQSARAEQDAFRSRAQEQFECAAAQAPAWSGPFDGLAGVVADTARTAAEKSERLELLKKASNLYWRAVYNHREDHRALNNWGVVLKEIAELAEGSAAQDAHDRACEKFRRATVIAPNSPNAYYNWALTLHGWAHRGNLDETSELLGEASKKYLEAIRLAPDRFQASYNRGVALMDMERTGALKREVRYDLLGQAGEMFRATTEIKPDLFEGFYNRGHALILRTSLSLAAGHTTDIELAVASLTKAVALRPDSLEAHNNLGVALHLYAGLTKQAEEKLRLSLGAVDELRLVLGREPREAKTMRALANTLQQLGRLQAPNDAKATFREALGLYDELLRTQTDEPGVHNELSGTWLGLANRVVGHERDLAVTEAEVHAKSAEELKRGAGAYNLACAAAMASRTDEAFRLLELALQVTEEARSHIEADPDLDTLKNDPRWRPLLDKYRPTTDTQGG